MSIMTLLANTMQWEFFLAKKIALKPGQFKRIENLICGHYSVGKSDCNAVGI